MKLLLIALYLILYFLIGFISNLFVAIPKKSNPKRAYRIANNIVRTGFRHILWICGVKLVINGKENIPQDTPALFVGNHRSYFDILSTHVAIKQPVGYVAKAEMEKIPFLSHWMKNIGCLFLDRSDNKKALTTILDGIAMLKKGYVSIYIFPEGTRGHSDTMAPFKKGSFKMAEKAHVPIIPVAIWNSDNVFENNGAFRKVRAQKVYISFGKPIYFTQLEQEEKRHIDSYVQNIVAKMIQELRQQYQI